MDHETQLLCFVFYTKQSLFLSINKGTGGRCVLYIRRNKSGLHYFNNLDRQFNLIKNP